jgi:glycosyltransferase involved in cell wall biosynthesis
MPEFQLWTFLPTVPDYVGTLGESLAVYYCVDEWSMFSYIDTDEMVAMERRLLERVDCVFCVNESLAARKRPFNPEVHVAPHGVHHELFAAALDEDLAVPDDVARLPGPVMGFVGTIQDWVDFDLLAETARRRPDWSFVLIGRILVEPEALAGIPNVHVLGPRPYEELPAYCKGFAVGMIPYLVSDQLPFRNPLKLREYLSAGLPVVCTALPEADHYAQWCWTAADADEFVDSLEAAAQADSADSRRERSRAMEDESWRARVARLLQIVDEVIGKR